MKMSDKEFDQLFSAKLENMEIGPPAHVWSNIANGLDGKPERVKKGLPFMHIAAGIVVIMGVGLFFLRPAKQKVELHGEYTIATQALKTIKSGETRVTDDDSTPSNRMAALLVTMPRKHSIKASKLPDAQQLAYAQPNPEQDMANSDTSVTHSVGSQLATRTVNNKLTTGVQPQALPQADIPAKQLAALTEQRMSKTLKKPVKKHKIRSLGDILNVVIAKVDKRNDKVIEFTNDADNDSFSVTGLNLGIVRAKKQN